MNKPIVNYAQMNIVFMPGLIFKKQFFEPHFLIKTLNYIVEHKIECAEYARPLPGERRA
jgi:hypothetical protein